MPELRTLSAHGFANPENFAGITPQRRFHQTPPVPPYYSCVSATHEAIRECTHINIPPPGMDRSPAMTEAWLKLAKLTGDSKVEGVRFHSRENLALEKLKESSVNLTDTLFFLTFLPDAYVAAQLKNFNKSRAKKL